MRDIGLLKIDRHFREGACKIICTRDEAECNALRSRAGEGEWLLEASDCMGPVILYCFRGEADDAILRLAAQVAAAYSDGASPEVRVKAISGASERELCAVRIPRDELQLARV